MELICEKGIGKTHAKWSPVSTAYYRLVPDITITKDITGDDAEELKRLCPTGVYDIEDLGGKKGSKLLLLVLIFTFRESLCSQCSQLHNLSRVHQARKIP
jgi:DNA-directed RNA polymerase alpha subunit